ncbi:hypothetical protein Ancab_036896 [Ancistrocladus abbreviatus]
MGVFERSQRFSVVPAVVVAMFLGQLAESKCSLEAIFNFGDSNSDTGGFWAAFPAQRGPFGMTFFKKPSGRATDGRVMVDFLAQAMGIPFLSPYLKSIGSDYRHGANFATLASTVLLPNTSLFVSGLSPFSLAIQLNQMKEFKTRVDEFQPKHGGTTTTTLPSTKRFRKSLYTFYIGQNDFTSNLAAVGTAAMKQSYLPVVSQIADTIKETYDLGGRTFWAMNLAPVGCYPAFLAMFPHERSDLDQYGCVISYNEAVIEYNMMLKDALAHTRSSLPHATIIYVDVHSVLLDLFRHPTSYGLKYGTRACCGEGGGAYNFNPKVYCGNSKVINGSIVTATACSDPSKYVSWDGIHATDAANKLVVQAILNGSLFDPPFPLHHLCDLHPIA